MRRLILLFSSLTLCLASAAQAMEVVTSIKPLQLIAAALTAGVTTPQQLLPNSASPHDYQLRPSDMRMLQKADLVVWIGPELENFLHKPLASLPQRVTQLGLLAALPEPAPVEQVAVAPGAENEHGAEHHHGQEDPHIWLDPANGVAIGAIIAEQLIRLDAPNADRYRANLAQFKQAVADTDGAIAALLAPLANVGYFVFHDAYRPFEARYRLNHLGAFTLSPERRPGARQLAAIRTRLQQPNAQCVFSEPQFTPGVLSAVTQGLPVRRAVLDPLGSDSSSYPELLMSLAHQFQHCLAP